MGGGEGWLGSRERGGRCGGRVPTKELRFRGCRVASRARAAMAGLRAGFAIFLHDQQFPICIPSREFRAERALT